MRVKRAVARNESGREVRRDRDPAPVGYSKVACYYHSDKAGLRKSETSVYLRLSCWRSPRNCLFLAHHQVAAVKL